MHKARRRLSIAALASLAVLGLVLPVSAAATPAAAPGKDIRDRVERLPGVTVVSEDKAPKGFRLFSLTIEQPVDHGNPKSGTFKQRLSLLHRNVKAPMVLWGSGYNLIEGPARSEPTEIVNGNQLTFEHRYFAPSIPGKPNPNQQLTIWQAATDQHRINTLFKRIYGANWLATGASKGGSVATYYRRFYPNDVQGTVPYVAPNDVVNTDDSYNEFLEQVGTPACRTKLADVRKAALQRSAGMLRLINQQAKKDKKTFDLVGSPRTALEIAAVDTPYAFWQYRGPADCKKIPTPKAPIKDIFQFFVDTADPLGNSDQDLEQYVPYYFQAGYEMGWPIPYEKGIEGLLEKPGFNQAPNFVPESFGVPRLRNGAMADIDSWVRNRGQRIMLVNGELDPWRAEPFQLGPGSKDSFDYVVPGANHGASIEQLPAKPKAEAIATIRRWAGLEAKPTKAGADVPGAPSSFNNPRMIVERGPI